MARKDVTDQMVLEAIKERAVTGESLLQILMSRTNEPMKVCWRAMERTLKRDYISFGTSLRTAWITPEGHALLARIKKEQEDATPSRT
ncbi:hypothetical protein D3C85_964200 [compost metagenome]